MKLFDDFADPTQNHLPQDGTVHYYGKILSSEKADYFYEKLLSTIDWKNDEAIIYGKKYVTKRKVAWYGSDPFAYTYSKTTKTALLWTEELEELKKIIENLTQETFNSCLLNLYHNGTEGMAWHSDAEKDLKKNGTIASLSLGAERRFDFKHLQTNQLVHLYLEHGSLLLMKDSTQTHWQHRLPTSQKIISPRINLTFRTIVNQ
ncbi:MAG: alpha-ketoglutarate-dependent dioxygenase AlkB [Cytophagales bacterium]